MRDTASVKNRERPRDTKQRRNAIIAFGTAAAFALAALSESSDGSIAWWVLCILFVVSGVLMLRSPRATT
jgi:hypothetical protein